MKKKRVVVAMSGGVDSSVAAALLKNQGYEVVGITMCFSAYGGSASGGNSPEPKRPACCGIQGIEDARSVAHKLGIRHYVLNMQKALNEYIVKDFCQEYISGRTPNPCIRCNQYLKFGLLLKKTLALGSDYLATGHYARIEKVQGIASRVKKYLLKKARDLNKDQSYFLYRLKESELKHTLFPLGDYTKEEVRKLAKDFGLPVADKLASQEICFIPDLDYRGFLKKRVQEKIRPGLILNKEGNPIGRHEGIAFYTIGQREGLGISLGYPAYVTRINPKNNSITVGRKEDGLKKEFFVKNAHFIIKPAGKKKVALKVKIRYNHKEMPAKICFCNNQIKVNFIKPEFAITPGQSAVFYQRDTVAGGGIIYKVLD